MSAEASWEDQIEEPKLIVRKNDDRWQGEDEEEDVKDNWDDEDEEEDKSTGSESTAKAVRKKVPLAVRIAEKEEKKRREMEEKRQQQEVEVTKTAEEILNEKLERQRLQEESDLFLAKESFGDDQNDQQVNSGSLLGMNLVSKEDFEEFKKLLVNKFQAVEKSQHYLPFLEATVREVCVTLEADDIKKISNSLNALFNEKIKAQKTTKSKKKKGASIKVEKTIAPEYDDFEDFDEFM